MGRGNGGRGAGASYTLLSLSHIPSQRPPSPLAAPLLMLVDFLRDWIHQYIRAALLHQHVALDIKKGFLRAR